MKILYLSTWFSHPLDNGSKLRVFHLLRGLAGRHEVTLLSAAYAMMAPTNVARVLDEHNAMGRWALERLQTKKTLPGRLRCWVNWNKGRRFESRLFPRFDLIAVVSEQGRDYCLAKLPGYTGPIAVIPKGVDCEHNRPGPVEPAPNTLVFNGALGYHVNYDAIRFYLAELFPAIHAQAPETMLTITGSTDGAGVVGRKVKRAGADKTVTTETPAAIHEWEKE